MRAVTDPVCASAAVGATATPYPSVSVVIATRDRPGLLERAVRQILSQDYPGHIECLVVFDHVPVRPLDLPEQPGRPVVLANTRRPGLPGGRNSGCAAATGDLLAFCDDDDAWHADKLRRQVDVLLADPQYGAVACGIRLQGPGITRNRPGRSTPVQLDDLLADRIMEVHPSTILVRRATWLAAGPVDEDIPGGYAEDYEWLLRVAALGPIAVVAQALVTVEWHGDSFFFGRWPMIVDALRYLLVKHPEFERSPRGRARIQAQIAFALAAAGRRRESLAEVWRVMRLNPREKRLFVTVPVLLGIVSGGRVLRMAQRRGRGV